MMRLKDYNACDYTLMQIIMSVLRTGTLYKGSIMAYLMRICMRHGNALACISAASLLQVEWSMRVRVRKICVAASAG